jgi:hypothetical protein
LEKVQKELRVYLSVDKDLDMMQYVHFKRDFEVKQWVERIHPDWLKVQPPSLFSIVNGPVLNKFPGDHAIGSLVTSQNSNPTTVQSMDVLEKKSSENTFEEEYVDLVLMWKMRSRSQMICYYNKLINQFQMKQCL